MAQYEVLTFTLFLLFIGLVLALDLGVFNRKQHVVRFQEAAIWSGVWVSLALGFFVLLANFGELVHGISTYEQLAEIIDRYNEEVVLEPGNYAASLAIYRSHISLQFLTGYLIEYALSVDNIFVMILIFSSFNVKERYYKSILFWGILGAVLMRFAFIFIGSALLQRFEWLIYVFGAFLLFTGIKMFFDNDDEDDKPLTPADHPVVKLASKYFGFMPRTVGGRFFVRDKRSGKVLMTPLFLVLLIIEFTDLIFAVDSVPAVFAIAKDPYVVFFSNIFAILGLRSMFFFLSNIMHLFHYLKVGLAFLMVFIGGKMVAHNWLEQWGITTVVSLYIVLGVLLASILASIILPKKESEADADQLNTGAGV